MLNAIALPRDWANYGALIDGFTKKYGIEVNDGNPDGASQDEINAITSRTGQDRAPDVVDPGQSFALSAAQQGLFAPPAGRPEVSRVTVPLAFGTWIRCCRPNGVHRSVRAAVCGPDCGARSRPHASSHEFPGTVR